MFSRLLSFVGGFKTYILIGVVIAAITGAATWKIAKGYYEGEKVEALERLLEVQNEINKQNAEVRDSWFDYKLKEKQQVKVITREVTKYVTKHSDTPTQCFDDDGLRLLEQIITREGLPDY